MRAILAALRNIFHREQINRDLDAEVRSYSTLLEEENMAKGIEPEAARRAARIETGGHEQLKEEVRSARAGTWVESIGQDIRFGARTLRKNPGFAAVAILTLALGIGANTAIFSLMQAVFLRNLPVDHPGQLVFVGWDASNWPRGIRQSGYGDSLSYSVFQDFHARNASFSSLFGFAPLGFDPANTNVVLDGQASLVDGVAVTADFFSGLGVHPILGRAIDTRDDGPDKPRAVVLGNGYWARRFGKDVGVLGRTIMVDTVPCVIVGVAPPPFSGVQPGRNPDIYISLSDGRGITPFGTPATKPPLSDPLWFWLVVMGRLKPGITTEAARVSLDTNFQQLLQGDLLKGTKPGDMPHINRLEPAGQGMAPLRQSFSDPLTLLQWMVALVLLMACTNLAALLLARATARRAEMGVRLAIGASRARLIRQLLIENLILALAGCALGILFAQWGARSLLVLISGGGSVGGGRNISLDVGLNVGVLAFAVGLALLTSLLFGLGPSLRATRVDIYSSLKDSGGEAARGSRSTIRSALVCIQVAVSLVLLAGAGLFLRTMRNLQNENLGFDRQQVLVFGIDPTQDGYDGPRLTNFYSALRDRLETIPGVSSATFSPLALISGWVSNGGAWAEGVQPSGGRPPNVLQNAVGLRYFQTMGIPLILGRDLDRSDLGSQVRVAVVNQTFARIFWPQGSPIGRRFSLSEKQYRPESSFEVVGVVQDAKFASVREKIKPAAYFPFTQAPWKLSQMSYMVKAAGDPAQLVAAIRSTVRDIDPNLPLYDMKTQTDQIDQSLSRERMFARLSTAFGILALLMASIGLYGLLVYSVGRRKHEIGIRVALGAQRGDILAMVLRQGILLTVLGIIAGIGGALAFSRVIQSYLFKVAPHDPWTLVGSALLLLVVAAAACWIPSRRAMRVDPMVALRYE